MHAGTGDFILCLMDVLEEMWKVLSRHSRLGLARTSGFFAAAVKQSQRLLE